MGVCPFLVLAFVRNREDGGAIWSLAGWHTPLVPALEKPRQEFKSSLVYCEFWDRQN